MNRLDDALRGSLADLADELAADADGIRPERVRASYQRRRRARLATGSVAAAVVLLAAGLPLTTAWLSSATTAGQRAAAGPARSTPAGSSGQPSTPATVTMPVTPQPDGTLAQARVEAARAQAMAAAAAARRAVDDQALPELYAQFLAVRSCLAAHGFRPAPPVGREAFVAAAGDDWNPYAGLAVRDVISGSAACPLPAR